jgi:hypothetical protein
LLIAVPIGDGPDGLAMAGGVIACNHRHRTSKRVIMRVRLVFVEIKVLGAVLRNMDRSFRVKLKHKDAGIQMNRVFVP